jgi:hypothetical protein
MIGRWASRNVAQDVWLKQVHYRVAPWRPLRQRATLGSPLEEMNQRPPILPIEKADPDAFRYPRLTAGYAVLRAISNMDPHVNSMCVVPSAQRGGTAPSKPGC